ncbi:PREDICTED: chitooligosaccharidolytic beta-N-acetylglucosaminidase [Ceratosolen solmsi marchali]|uniref:Beta-hexosaminidase n=1 Tax=Ceratosolen solmsi marchali TaxID=326594 RepID=A0AAJ7E2E3_9HYME|nr:PREDICTED: chitooligosaccharidolytic beta-N-acetylglucosaminidase [Ceratosolen solmsi marchali]
MKARIVKLFCRKRIRGPRRHVQLLVATSAVIMMVLFFLIFVRFFGGVASNNPGSPWYYYCESGICKKAEIIENVTSPLCLGICQLFCGEVGGIWPKPTGHTSFGNYMAKLNPYEITLSGVDFGSITGQLIQENVNKLKQNIMNLASIDTIKKGGYSLILNIIGQFNNEAPILTINTSENYTINIYQKDNKLYADISSATYFGIRHAIETLSQLIVYDDLYGEIKITRDVYIQDGPVFPYRGILLDTARNFIDKATILRTIEAMSMSKLNTFHWHITDSHSFPYSSRTWPNMPRYGAYSSAKIYTEKDIKEIINFGILNGVRVIPEFDAPAHIGEGWQWVGHNSTVCFKAEPWQQYCVEPPCGQLNPTSEKVYEILEGIYTDMLRDFQPDFFHMGGDEVSIKCWNSSNLIKDWMIDHGLDFSETSFYKLWNYFQSKAYETLIKANNGNKLPVILWTSGLTNEDNLQFLDPKKYIIQIWTTKTDNTIGRLIKNDFRVIFSNYDALYLDCGFGAWIGEGNNWCAPYKAWQNIYENSPMKILENQGFSKKHKHLVLGSEAALWSEQVDSTSVDSRLWPRSAALAERLWSDPSSSWIHAEQRMLKHRERLVQRGILADSLEPEWCLQNQGHCYL